jgi:hypothetical protein
MRSENHRERRRSTIVVARLKNNAIFTEEISTTKHCAKRLHHRAMPSHVWRGERGRGTAADREHNGQ